MTSTSTCIIFLINSIRFFDTHGLLVADRKQEEKVKGRFIVFMTEDSNDGHLNKFFGKL